MTTLTRRGMFGLAAGAAVAAALPPTAVAESLVEVQRVPFIGSGLAEWYARRMDEALFQALTKNVAPQTIGADHAA